MGWTTEPDATAYLLAGIDGEGWADLSVPDRDRYLTAAYDRLRDHPAYCYPDEATRRMREAQALLAAYLLQNGGDAGSGIPAGVKGYRLLDYSVTYGKPETLRSARENDGILLPGNVADKLSEYLCPIGTVATLTRVAETEE